MQALLYGLYPTYAALLTEAILTLNGKYKTTYIFYFVAQFKVILELNSILWP